MDLRLSLSIYIISAIVGCSASGSDGPSSGGADAGASGGATAGTGGAISGGSGGSGAGSPGGSGGSGGTASITTEADACVHYIERWCHRAIRCGTYAPEQHLQCMENHALDCPDLFFAEGSLRTIEGMIECAAVWQTWSCDLSAPPPCAIGGTLPDGEGCVGSAQCEGYCSPGSLDCGICASRGPLGSTCEPSGFACEVGAYCSDAGLCEPLTDPPADPPPPSLGDPCPDGRCADGAYCGRIDPGASPTCLSFPGPDVDRPGPGERCALLGVPCAADLECLCNDQPCAEPTCRRVRHVGQSCTEPGDVCHAAARCAAGVCVTDVEAGQYAAACGP